MTAQEALAELGLGPGANVETIRRAYLRRAAEVELTGPTRELLGEAIATFRAALETQDPATIDAKRADLLELLVRVERHP